MTRISLITSLGLLLILELFNASVPHSSLDSAFDEADKQAVNAAVQKAYESLSFTRDKPADFEALDDVFIEEAIFRSFRSGTMQVLFKEPYFEGYQKTVESGRFEAVVEKEVWGKTEVFGNIAQRISTYELYYNDLSKPQERGVNSFQLVKIDGEWKITSTIYDVEKTGQPIPKNYLK